MVWLIVRANFKLNNIRFPGCQGTTTPTDTKSTPVEESTSAAAVSTVADRATEVTSTHVNDDICYCPCYVLRNLTKANSVSRNSLSIEEKVRKIQEDMKIDRHNTAQYRQWRSSADDDRMSAQALGYVGILFICLVMGLVVLIDVTNVIEMIKPADVK